MPFHPPGSRNADGVGPMRIGEVAGAAGVNVQTVRYYERRGLLEEPPRTPSGYRTYEAGAVDRIRFIQRAQDLGFTLNEIEELLELRVEDAHGCPGVEARTARKLEEVRRKITELRRMEAVLEELVTACRSRSPTTECPILRALEEDPASANGGET
jgi:Hg(II)-responsive transcriptional regulator